MKRIGILSDTHGFMHEKVLRFFQKTDEIWHAGDIGNMETAQRLARFKPLKAVYGNIDGHVIRNVYPAHQRFMCEDIDVWMTHIGGYPGRYDSRVKPEILINPPKLFISGHSHILKVMYDKKLGLLHINPGAAGNHGLHQVYTVIRLTIDGDQMKDLEVWEMERH